MREKRIISNSLPCHVKQKDFSLTHLIVHVKQMSVFLTCLDVHVKKQVYWLNICPQANREQVCCERLRGYL